jgi:hypothetical protein
MRIHEILFLNNDPTEDNRSDPQLDLRQTPFSDRPDKSRTRLGQELLEPEPLQLS